MPYRKREKSPNAHLLGKFAISPPSGGGEKTRNKVGLKRGQELMWRMCVREKGGGQPTVRREKARRATRGHYGKAETVIHCSKKDEIAREGATK